MPASITGCSMSRISVSRVRIRRMVRVGPRRHPGWRTCRGASGGAWPRWPGASPRTASGRSCGGSSRSRRPPGARRRRPRWRSSAPEQRASTCGGRPARARRTLALVALAPPRSARTARRPRSPAAASRPVRSAWPMPSPVIGRVAAAASPDEQRPAAGRGRGHLVDPGRDRPGPVRALRPRRRARGGSRCGAGPGGRATARPCRAPVTVPPRWMPKPTLARPSGSGNDQR